MPASSTSFFNTPELAEFRVKSLGHLTTQKTKRTTLFSVALWQTEGVGIRLASCAQFVMFTCACGCGSLGEIAVGICGIKAKSSGNGLNNRGMFHRPQIKIPKKPQRLRLRLDKKPLSI